MGRWAPNQAYSTPERAHPLGMGGLGMGAVGMGALGMGALGMGRSAISPGAKHGVVFRRQLVDLGIHVGRDRHG